MKNINFNKYSGYSVIISLLIIGFLLVLTTGIFVMVTNEMKDNRAMGDYIRAYAGAESAQELALLKIKKNGYAYYDKIDHNVNNRSIILSDNPLDTSNYHPINDVLISYDIGSKVNEYEGTLEPLEYAIIPLFFIDELGEHKVSKIYFTIPFGNSSNLSWNIIGKESGLSGTGITSIGVKKELTTDGLKFSKEEINDFINNSDTNYLVLLNSGDMGLIKYNLKSIDPNEYFSKPETTIISSGEIGNYKQNLSTRLNNTEFLNMLKYSIYSN